MLQSMGSDTGERLNKTTITREIRARKSAFIPVEEVGRAGVESEEALPLYVASSNNRAQVAGPTMCQDL